MEFEALPFSAREIAAMREQAKTGQFDTELDRHRVMQTIETLRNETAYAIINREKAKIVLKNVRRALANCYDVLEWPANGQSDQDKAIRMIDELLGEVNESR